MAPPLFPSGRRVQIEPFAHARRRNRDAARGTERSHALERLVPAVHRQIERAVVDRQQPIASQIDVRLHGFFRLHVDVRPLRIVSPRFDQRDVERPQALADGTGSWFPPAPAPSREQTKVAEAAADMFLARYG